ncbi:phosphate uptake regulator PhoU [Halorubrum tebenquichense]|uniref:phosphate uptake regulator PhoU n=1 Tax=Halorubrum tebenquichense TaxID=119434 RepID=UPI00137568CD|nr:phosphate uptake regulator PhoU [Halorubrum tebenquichense]
MSIPAQWAKDHNIEAADTAYLYTHRDGSLVVRWNENEHSDLATTQIILSDTDSRVAKRMLRAAYTAGFTQITLRAQDELTSEQRRAITTCTRQLTGVEISEETDCNITVQYLLDADDVSIRQSLLQLQSITLSMHEAAMEFAVGESDESEYIINRDEEADRILQLITRHFNRSLLELAELDQLGVTRPQLFEYYVTARQLERIADHAVKIVRCVQRTDHAISEELLPEMSSISADTHQVIEDAAEAVINSTSTDVVHSTLNRCERVIQEARKVDQTLADRAPREAYVLTRVLDSLIRTAKYSENIAELRLRTSLRV